MCAAELVSGLRTRVLRARFEQVSRRALARGRRTALLIVDLNGDVDDRLRAEFTSVLRHCAPPPAHAVRLSATGFAILLPEINTPETAYDVAGRLAAALGPIMIDGRLVTLAAAIGVAVAATPGELTHDQLADRAETAMRKAKSQGPDTRWAIWQDSPGPGLSAAAA